MSQDPAPPKPSPQALSTRLIHDAYRAPEGFAAATVGVHRASTVLFPDTAAMRSRDWRERTGYTYGLHGTPTSFTLEARIAQLEGGRHVCLLPSGLAALTLVNAALLRQGDHLLLPANSYGPNLEFAREVLPRWGVTHGLYDPMDAGSLRAALTPQTRLVWLEAAGSVTLEFPPLDELIAVAKAAGARCALDNTWGAGIAFAPFDLGVDISAHALTKYPSGGGDVLMGAVSVRDDGLMTALRNAQRAWGFGVSGNDCEAVLRGLPSTGLRYAAADATARALAAWMATQPGVLQVLHPALPGSPGHAHWKRLAPGGAAALFSVLFDDERWTAAQVDAFVEALHCFGLGYSWAGPMSLAVPYPLRVIRPAGTPGSGALRGHLVRFAIGLEAEADLRADLQQALARTLLA